LLRASKVIVMRVTRDGAAQEFRRSAWTIIALKRYRLTPISIGAAALPQSSDPRFPVFHS
jgi:hypothetical protein